MKWIKVSDRLPKLERLCLLYDEISDKIFVGSRTCVIDEGWFWANSYGSFWWNGEKYDADAEVDDEYDVTHWIYLPNPPVKKKEKEEDESESKNPVYSKKELISMIKDAMANDPHYIRHVKEKHGELGF